MEIQGDKTEVAGESDNLPAADGVIETLILVLRVARGEVEVVGVAQGRDAKEF